MSHQEPFHGTTNAEDLQAALDWLVPESLLADLQFRDQNYWTPQSLVFAALMWSWSAKLTLGKRFVEARKIVARNAPTDQQPGNSYSGFIKRLHCWSKQLIDRLVAEFRRTMREDLSQYHLVGGWLLLAGDGSRTATPRTRSNEERFAARKKSRQQKKMTARQKQRVQKANRNKRKSQTQEDCDKKAGTPQIWLTMLYHVGLGLPWDWRSGPSDSSERDHLIDMARSLPSQSLVTLDAGFVGYDFWQTLDQAGVCFVARVGSNVKLLKNLGYVRRRNDIVHVWPDRAQRKLQPPLTLRLECFRGGKEEVYLVTNVLDIDRLSQSQMIDIYAARWGVEIYYRDFKQTFARGKMRSKSADNTQLELDWSILGLWAMCLYAAAHHAANGIPPKRRSVAGLLHAFRLPMEQHKSDADEQEDLYTLLLVAVKDEYERHSSKASRNYPRKKKKHAIGTPILTNATPQQREVARTIKNEVSTAA
jgi:hypothetical protein